jgi:hypothetical protein
LWEPRKEAFDEFLDKIKLDMPPPVCRNGSRAVTVCGGGLSLAARHFCPTKSESKKYGPGNHGSRGGPSFRGGIEAV